MACILHQQVTNQCRDEVSRNGETGPIPCDRLKETETILPFTHHLGPHQLSVEESSLEARIKLSLFKLSQFKIEFQPRSAIKGQALADFIVEFSHMPDERPEEAPGPSLLKIP